MTVSTSELLVDQFMCARDLIVNKSKKDPPHDPYKSKYEARELLLSIEKSLADQCKTNVDNVIIENRLAVIYYLLGSIFYDVEEPSQGSEYTMRALKKVLDDPIHPDRIICYINCLNLLGFSACKYDRIDESLELLDKADSAFRSYKEKHTETPKEFGVIFGKYLEEENNGLEKAYTATLFYLAQVYSAKGDRLKSAKYCHTTLKRQLEMKEFDAIEWALNSATLSQYLIEKNAYKEARSHLAAAQVVLEKCHADYNLMEESEEVKAM